MSSSYYKVFESTVRGDDNALRRIRQYYGTEVFKWPKDTSTQITAIEVACRHGYKDCLKELLDAYPVNQMTKSHIPSVITAIELCCHLGRAECLDLLLESGADPNVLISESKGTPLHLVASKDHVNCGIVLLRHKADINLSNTNGVTPLHKAAQNIRLSCIRLFLQKGANPNATTTEGFTPLHLVALDHLGPGMPHNHTLVCVSVLLSCKAVNMNTQSNSGFSPLHLACISPNVATAHMLLDYGASCRLKTNDDESKLPIDCLPGDDHLSGEESKKVHELRQRLTVCYKGHVRSLFLLCEVFIKQQLGVKWQDKLTLLPVPVSVKRSLNRV